MHVSFSGKSLRSYLKACTRGEEISRMIIVSSSGARVIFGEDLWEESLRSTRGEEISRMIIVSSSGARAIFGEESS